MLWAITKGSFLNKLIILPAAFALSALAPWVIEPILVLGGGYLAFEGVEKVVHYARPSRKGHRHPEAGPSEPERIRSAIVVDFILSVEIVILALGQVMDAVLVVQIISVTLIACWPPWACTELWLCSCAWDDAGLALMKRNAPLARRLGAVMVAGASVTIKGLSIIGTVALLLVSGGIFHHHLPESTH